MDNLALAVIGVLIGLASLAIGIHQSRAANKGNRQAASPPDLAVLARRLGDRRTELTARAREELDPTARDVLARPGWLLDQPLPLGSVRLDLVADPPPVDDARRRAASVRAIAGERSPRTLSEALAEHDAGLYDGSSYRLLDVSLDAAEPHLVLARTSYFVGLDTTEVLAYEYLDATDGPRSGGMSYRQWVGDPFDLSRRAAIPGVCALTLRRDPVGGSSFLLLERDGQVSMGHGMVHVVPAGEFQPADQTLLAARRDLDLWRTFQREFAEELLDHEDARGKQGQAPDVTAEPYRTLDALRVDGRLDVRLLGVGLDPLTWKPELLLACAIDADGFDTLLEDRVKRSEEGLVLVGESRGIPFREDVVEAQAAEPGMLPAASACLRLAWRHRETLGLVPPS